MDLESLGNLGEIIGAVAVIISILYMARQLRQSNTVARADS